MRAAHFLPFFRHVLRRTTSRPRLAVLSSPHAAWNGIARLLALRWQSQGAPTSPEKSKIFQQGILTAGDDAPAIRAYVACRSPNPMPTSAASEPGGEAPVAQRPARPPVAAGARRRKS